MKKTLYSLSLSLASLLSIPQQVLAQGDEEVDSVFGTIEPPAGVGQYNEAAGGIGLVLFLSNLIRVSTVIAGVWVMINFILAGWGYISSSGDSKAHSEASSRMTNSLIGLAIIVGAYSIAGLVGLVFFGDASYIINPTFQGVSTEGATN